MSIDSDTSADELGRAFAAMAKAARAAPDAFDVWRAIHEWREHVREADGDDRPSAPADVIALMLKTNAVLLDSHGRLVRRWQRLMARAVPRIRERLDDYRAEPDPLPEIERRLIDEVRRFMDDVGELALDHGRTVKQDIEELRRELFLEPSALSEAVRMARAAS